HQFTELDLPYHHPAPPTAYVSDQYTASYQQPMFYPDPRVYQKSAMMLPPVHNPHAQMYPLQKSLNPRAPIYQLQEPYPGQFVSDHYPHPTGLIPPSMQYSRVPQFEEEYYYEPQPSHS